MSPASSTNKIPSKPNRFEFIDALRGFACLWVVLFHTYLDWVACNPDSERFSRNPLAVFLVNGYIGVDIFLVLSGFCLFYPVIRKNPLSEVRVNLQEFYRRRAYRILPPYYVALTFFGVLNLVRPLRILWSSPGKTTEVLWIDLPAHALMVHNLHPRTFYSINGAFWSLALESQLYLVFPFLLYLIRRWRFAGMMFFCGAVSCLWYSLALHFMPKNSSHIVAATVFASLPARLFEFVCGMAAAVLIVHPVRALPQVLSVFLLLGGLKRAISGPVTFLPDSLFYGVVVAAILIVLSEQTQRFPKINRFFAPLTWFGTISYSVYLIHAPLVTLTRPIVSPLDLNPYQMLLLALVTVVPVLTGLGYSFFWFFERPFLQSNSRSTPQRPPSIRAEKVSEK